MREVIYDYDKKRLFKLLLIINKFSELGRATPFKEKRRLIKMNLLEQYCKENNIIYLDFQSWHTQLWRITNIIDDYLEKGTFEVHIDDYRLFHRIYLLLEEIEKEEKENREKISS